MKTSKPGSFFGLISTRTSSVVHSFFFFFFLLFFFFFVCCCCCCRCCCCCCRCCCWFVVVLCFVLLLLLLLICCCFVFCFCCCCCCLPLGLFTYYVTIISSEQLFQLLPQVIKGSPFTVWNSHNMVSLLPVVLRLLSLPSRFIQLHFSRSFSYI